MITTISLSPAIDKRLEFASFTLGGTNRVVASETEGAGKAVNVAMAAQALGLSALSAGILPGNGQPVTDHLSVCGVKYDFISAPGNVRVNQKLLDRSTGVFTEIGEKCPEAPEEVLAKAEEQAVDCAKKSEFLVLTGSLPPGCPVDWYARVIRRVRAEAPGCRVVLDAEGERFTCGAKEKPWLVKPNQYELGLYAGKTLETREEILAAARALLNEGVQVVAVSLGAQGALAVRGEEAVFVPGLKLQVRTTVGAGDAMVAGLMRGFSEKDDLAWALRCGTASAAARCMYAGPGYLDGAVFAQMLEKTEAERV